MHGKLRNCIRLTDNKQQQKQGRIQKFVLVGIKVLAGIKLFNSRSDVIFTP